MSRAHRNGTRHNQRSGFTLVELIIVLVIVGVVAAMAVPRLDLAGYRADAGARLVRGALQVAHRTAIARQSDVIVSFDADGGGVRIAEDLNSNGQIDADERVTWKRFDGGIRFATPPATIDGGNGGAVVLTRSRAVEGLPSVIFRRNGAASSDVELYLTDATGERDAFRGIAVVQATGRADWYRLRDGNWKEVGL